MCALVFIAYAQTFTLGFHKVCYYDCGSRRYGYYDRLYRVDPEYICPARLKLA